MTSRPILFQPDMVRAILAGKKTQTRRLVKAVGNQAKWLTPELLGMVRGVELVDALLGPHKIRGIRLGSINGPAWISSPYGGPGDQLWVKESWRAEARWNKRKPLNVPGESTTHYEADGPWRGPGKMGRLRQSIFMRHWMSRIALYLEEVRVERLQDITEADALAEGIERPPPEVECRQALEHQMMTGAHAPQWSPCGAYRALWESINGAGSWDASPWVWVLTFRNVGHPAVSGNIP